MAWLVWTGAAISFAGLIGLFWCIWKVFAARRAQMSDDDLRDLVRKMVPLNMGALMVSVMGLMLVIVGIFLG